MEAFGVFCLVFVGGWTVHTVRTGGGSALVAALPHGLILFVLIIIAGPISGAHFNPAVTIPMIITKDIKPVKGLVYILMHFLGSILAGLALWGVEPKSWWETGGYATSYPTLSEYSSGQTVDDKVTIFGCFILEFFATMILVLAIYTGVRKKMCEWKIGGLVAMIVTFGLVALGGVTGGALNPVRHFGPAILDKGVKFADRRGWWIFYAGPILGGIAGGCFSHFFLHADESQGG